MVALPGAIPLIFIVSGSKSITPEGDTSHESDILEASDGEMLTLTDDSSPTSTEDLATVTVTDFTGIYSTVILQLLLTPEPCPVSVVVPFFRPATYSEPPLISKLAMLSSAMLQSMEETLAPSGTIPVTDTITLSPRGTLREEGIWNAVTSTGRTSTSATASAPPSHTALMTVLPADTPVMRPLRTVATSLSSLVHSITAVSWREDGLMENSRSNVSPSSMRIPLEGILVKMISSTIPLFSSLSHPVSTTSRSGSTADINFNCLI